MTSLTKKELLAQSLARHHVLQRASGSRLSRTSAAYRPSLPPVRARRCAFGRETTPRAAGTGGLSRSGRIAVPSMWCLRASLACTSRRAAIRARLPRHGMAGVSR